MAQVINGPHDGDTYPAGGQQGWDQMPLPVTPLLHEVLPGEPVALYAWADGCWRLKEWIGPGVTKNDHDLALLMYRSPEARAYRALVGLAGGGE